MSAAGQQRALRRELQQQGAELIDGAHHLQVRREGRLVVVLPRGSRLRELDRRHLLNVRAALRRAGFEV
jgi:hypothetical protein